MFKKFFYTLLFLSLTTIAIATNGVGTYYGDSTDVTVSGTVSNYLVTLTNVALTTGKTYRLTVYAQDTEGNDTTSYIDFTTVSAGGASVAITSPASGTLYTAPTSRTVTVGGTYAGTPATMTYSCPDCTATSGSVTFSGGTWSKSVELGTSGLGANIISNPNFSSTAGWTTSGNWTINTTAGTISDTGSTSAYGYSQAVTVDYHSWQRVCEYTSVSTAGVPYLSQWSFVGAGNGAAFASGVGSHCLDKLVVNATANLFIVGSSFTGSINETTVQNIGTRNAFTVSIDGGASTDTIYLTHFTASSGTTTTLTNQYPYYDTMTLADSNVQMRIANIDSAPASSSIAVNIAITGEAGIDYTCADTLTTTCTAYSGEEGEGWDVVINPASFFSHGETGEEYTITVSADGLSETSYTFKTIPPPMVISISGG